MKPSELSKLIRDRHASKTFRALYVVSSPGVGKTQIAEQVAKDLGGGFIAWHVPTMLPEDCAMPVVMGANRDRLNFIVSDRLPVVGSDWPDTGILLLDELAQGDATIQKTCAQLIQQRELHGKRLKDGWTIIATGNRQKDRAGANRVLGHLANRMTRVELDVSLDDWCQWAMGHGISPETIGFIRFRPELLSQYDANAEVNATPRSWAEGVDTALRSGYLSFETAKGDVGEGPAAEYMAFLKVWREMPSIDAILLNPDSVDVPNGPATKYAVCTALAYRASDSTFARSLSYVQRLGAEFGVLFVRDAVAKCPAICHTAAFSQWVIKNAELYA